MLKEPPQYAGGNKKLNILNLMKRKITPIMNGDHRFA
jgi:hypothetical protein